MMHHPRRVGGGRRERQPVWSNYALCRLGTRTACGDAQGAGFTGSVMQPGGSGRRAGRADRQADPGAGAAGRHGQGHGRRAAAAAEAQDRLRAPGPDDQALPASPRPAGQAGRGQAERLAAAPPGRSWRCRPSSPMGRSRASLCTRPGPYCPAKDQSSLSSPGPTCGTWRSSDPCIEPRGAARVGAVHAAERSP